MDTLQLFVVAISIIVSTRGDLAANDRPAAHVAAGVPVGVAINKTVDRNDDLTHSFVYFAMRGNKGNRLLSDRRNRADRSRATTVIDEDTKSARPPSFCWVSAVRSRSRVRHKELYILFLGILGLYAKGRET